MTISYLLDGTFSVRYPFIAEIVLEWNWISLELIGSWKLYEMFAYKIQMFK